LIDPKDFSVPARAPVADVAPFHYGYPLYVMIPGQIIGRRQAMEAATDYYSVVGLLRFFEMPKCF
jgi:hypothetical protein